MTSATLEHVIALSGATDDMQQQATDDMLLATTRGRDLI
jgi:hypothetical protein